MSSHFINADSAATEIFEEWLADPHGHLDVAAFAGHGTINTPGNENGDIIVPMNGAKRILNIEGKLWFRNARRLIFANQDGGVTAQHALVITGNGELSGVGVAFQHANMWRVQDRVRITHAPDDVWGFETIRLPAEQTANGVKGQNEHNVLNLATINCKKGVHFGEGSHRNTLADFLISGAAQPFKSHGSTYGKSRVAIDVQDGVTSPGVATFCFEGGLSAGCEYDLFCEQPTDAPLFVRDVIPSNWHGQSITPFARVKLHLTHATSAPELAVFHGPVEHLPSYEFHTNNPQNGLHEKPSWRCTDAAYGNEGEIIGARRYESALP